MALDFPRAWELARAAPAATHHPQCSHIQADGALLCDLACPVIADAPEYRCPAMHGAGGTVMRTEPPHYGPCEGHAPAGGPDDNPAKDGVTS